MDKSLLEEILAHERRIAERTEREKDRIRSELDAQQRELEQRYTQAVRRLNTSFKARLTEQTSRIDAQCSSREASCRESLRAQASLPTEQLASIVERHLLNLLRGDSYDHSDGQG